MTLFESVKDSITPCEAAERYDIKVRHNGMCKCPFHNDKNPSMKLYEKRYHCFGCQADGDVISFISRLFNITPKEAAMKLADDFGIRYDSRGYHRQLRKRYEPREDILAHKVSYCFRKLADYKNQLVMWKQQYAPKSMDEEWHPLFSQALENLPNTEYRLDVLLSGSDAEKEQIVTDYLVTEKEIREALMKEPTVNIPVYNESAEYARNAGELDVYRASRQANIDCKNDIEKAIANHFDGMRLDRKAIDGVMERYGSERVSQVLAATVQVKAWDGRFSSANKDWAFTFDFPDPVNDMGYDRRDSFAVTSHPAVLDGFINLVRQEIKNMEHAVMDEKKYAVLLTDSQEVKTLECDPQEELFDIARGVIGCDWIELVEPESLAENGYVMLIDEEGKLRSDQPSINCIASDLYGSDRHGDPIVGSAVIVHANEESLELMTNTEADQLAGDLQKRRDQSIEKISKAFGVHPEHDSDRGKSVAMQRQPCMKHDMER